MSEQMLVKLAQKADEHRKTGWVWDGIAVVLGMATGFELLHSSYGAAKVVGAVAVGFAALGGLEHHVAGNYDREHQQLVHELIGNVEPSEMPTEGWEQTP